MYRSEQTSPTIPFASFVRTGPSVLFESFEHLLIGDRILLHTADGDVRRGADYLLALPNGLQLTYGRVVALAGDFFGIPGEAIADDPHAPERFLRAFGQMAEDADGVSQVQAINVVMQDEITALVQAIERGETDLYKVYQSLDLNGRYNRATGGGSILTDYWPMGRYLALAASNFDHFGEDAVRAYAMGHAQALTQALLARKLSGAAREKALQLAYAQNAFADHFLSDLFSSGHLRTPRRALDRIGRQSAVPEGAALAGLCAKAMHDEDSYHGLTVRNARGETWRAYGDKKLLDHGDEENLRRVVAAVQASAGEIWNAFASGQLPERYAALACTPDLAALQDRHSAANLSPLFTAETGGQVLRRKDVVDLASRDWTHDWWLASTVALLRSTESQRLGGRADTPLNIDPIVVQFFRNGEGRMGMIEYGPGATGYGTLWGAGDMGQGAGLVALLDLDLEGDGATQFVQLWQAGADTGVIVYGPDAQAAGYAVRYASAGVLAGATGGQWRSCRRREGGAWMVRSAPLAGALSLDALRARTDAASLAIEVLWRSAQLFAQPPEGCLLAADIDGDGNDELVWMGVSLNTSLCLAAARLGDHGPEVMVAPREQPRGSGLLALAADVDGSGRQAIVCIGEAADATGGFTRVCRLGVDSRSFDVLDRQNHAFSGALIGWLVVDADEDGAADLVRVGALDGRVTVQLLRSRKDGSFDAGVANTFDIPAASVGLLTSRVGGRGRYVVHHLLNHGGQLGWAVFTPNASGSGFGLAALQRDMGQGAAALGFFTANAFLAAAD
ncbi:hypothetical protein [Acidovorax sp. BL-A-41-H1]|uniref:hypothetical protein n=1 Tax=Acidovorax sp. BL-A-41-H1 TaxID=3421102 RepID=UPI003F7A494B